MEFKLTMKSKKFWIILIVLIVLGGAAFYFRNSLTTTGGGAQAQTQSEGQGAGDANATVAIRPAADVAQVSAAGNIALANKYSLGIETVEGIITEVDVQPGDTVSKDDLLLSLDTTELEQTIRYAELTLDVAENQMDQLQEPPNPAEVASAKASLLAAKENLAELQQGPSAAELDAAEAALSAAEASYQDLLDGSSESEITEASAGLQKAFITLEQAQDAYNKIAYRGDVGSTQQAMDLQTATIDYDTAKAAFDIATEDASDAEIQAALKTIKDAQVQLDDLNATRTELANADAQVASAEATLATLLEGPTEAELGAAQLTIQQAQLDLDNALADRDQASLRAPADGTILTVDVEAGQQTTSGLTAITMADLTDLELPVYVAEVDISKVELGQPVTVAIDALPGKTLNGEVSRIVPISSSESGVVNYEVMVRLLDLTPQDKVLPGMTAVATMQGDSTENAWLVPSNAIVEFEGKSYVRVMQNGEARRVAVTPSTAQGEWTVVQSDELTAGDQVVGHVTSFAGQEENNGSRGGFMRPPR